MIDSSHRGNYKHNVKREKVSVSKQKNKAYNPLMFGILPEQYKEQLNNKVFTEEEEKSDEADHSLGCKIVILHTSRVFKIWKVLIVFLEILSSFFYAYFAAFRASGKHHVFEMNIMEIFFAIDFVVNFISSYPSPEKTCPKPITDLNMIRDNYLHNGFI